MACCSSGPPPRLFETGGPEIERVVSSVSEQADVDEKSFWEERDLFSVPIQSVAFLSMRIMIKTKLKTETEVSLKRRKQSQRP